jgi:hypothetical protein
MNGRLFLLVVVLVAIVSVAYSAAGKNNGPRKYNKMYQLLMSKLIEVRFKTENYMVQNNIPMAPSQDYPYAFIQLANSFLIFFLVDTGTGFHNT